MAATPAIAPALAHDAIEQAFDDIWTVRGRANMGKMQITRRMTIVRHNGELTLISAVRLSDAALTELEKLGRITNVMKIGFHHGVDDAFYVQKYSARYWVLENHPADKLNGLTADVRMNDTTKLPFPDATLHTLTSCRKPESVILVSRGGGILIACDAIQNNVDLSACNFMGRRVMSFFGFNTPMGVGVGVVVANKQRAGYSGRTLWEDLEMVDKLKWTNFITAHGDPVTNGRAHATFTLCLREKWGPEKLNLRYDPMAAQVNALRNKVVAVLLLGAGAFAAWYFRGQLLG